MGGSEEMDKVVELAVCVDLDVKEDVKNLLLSYILREGGWGIPILLQVGNLLEHLSGVAKIVIENSDDEIRKVLECSGAPNPEARYVVTISEIHSDGQKKELLFYLG